MARMGIVGRKKEEENITQEKPSGRMGVISHIQTREQGVPPAQLSSQQVTQQVSKPSQTATKPSIFARAYNTAKKVGSLLVEDVVKYSKGVGYAFNPTRVANLIMANSSNPIYRTYGQQKLLEDKEAPVTPKEMAISTAGTMLDVATLGVGQNLVKTGAKVAFKAGTEGGTKAVIKTGIKNILEGIVSKRAIPSAVIGMGYGGENIVKSKDYSAKNIAKNLIIGGGTALLGQAGAEAAGVVGGRVLSKLKISKIAKAETDEGVAKALGKKVSNYTDFQIKDMASTKDKDIIESILSKPAGFKAGTAAEVGFTTKKIGEAVPGVKPTKAELPAVIKKTTPEIKPAVPEVVPIIKQIPKELEPLAREARKYKSAEEFGKVVDNALQDINKNLNTPKGFNPKPENKKLVDLVMSAKLTPETLPNFYNQATQGAGKVASEVATIVSKGQKVNVEPTIEELNKALTPSQKPFRENLRSTLLEKAETYEAKSQQRQLYDQLISKESINDIKRIAKSKFAQTSDFDVTKVEGFDEITQTLRDATGNQNLTSSEAFDIIDNLPTWTELNKEKPIALKPTEKGAIIKTPENKPIVVPGTQLPVGEGKVKTSKLAQRITDSIENLPEETKKQLPTYQVSNSKEQIKMAAEYVEKYPEDAMSVLKGKKPVPKGLLRNSIGLALEEKATLEGDSELARNLTSLYSTRSGQEIEILKMRDPTSSVAVMTDLQRAKVEAIGGKEKVRAVTKTTTDEVKNIIKQSAPKRQNWAEFMDSLKCKG